MRLWVVWDEKDLVFFGLLRDECLAGYFNPFAKVRAENFLVHPFVHEGFSADDGYWQHHKNYLEAYTKATTTQRKIKANMADGTKQGTTTTLMRQGRPLFETVANEINKAPKLASARAWQ